MDKIQMSMGDMLSRLARFKELEVSAQAFVDTRLGSVGGGADEVMKQIVAKMIGL